MVPDLFCKGQNSDMCYYKISPNNSSTILLFMEPHMHQVVAKDELDNLKLRISPVEVRMADGSIRVMKHAELLPLYYLIPEEILSK